MKTQTKLYKEIKRIGKEALDCSSPLDANLLSSGSQPTYLTNPGPSVTEWVLLHREGGVASYDQHFAPNVVSREPAGPE